jgi:hypothetical protein
MRDQIIRLAHREGHYAVGEMRSDAEQGPNGEITDHDRYGQQSPVGALCREAPKHLQQG